MAGPEQKSQKVKGFLEQKGKKDNSAGVVGA